MIYPRLQHLRLRQDDRRLLGVLVLVGDLGLAQVDREQGVALDKPATAAALALGNEDIRDLDARGHQLRQPLQFLDGRSLRVDDDGRRRGGGRNRGRTRIAEMAAAKTMSRRAVGRMVNGTKRGRRKYKEAAVKRMPARTMFRIGFPLGSLCRRALWVARWSCLRSRRLGLANGLRRAWRARGCLEQPMQTIVAAARPRMMRRECGNRFIRLKTRRRMSGQEHDDQQQGDRCEQASRSSRFPSRRKMGQALAKQPGEDRGNENRGKQGDGDDHVCFLWLAPG